MSRSRIHAIIEDGPRAGDTVELDAAHEGDPPKEFLLADEHLGPRPADHRQAPAGAVSTYRLMGRDEERGATSSAWRHDSNRLVPGEAPWAGCHR